jgi:HEAT repeat protein
MRKLIAVACLLAPALGQVGQLPAQSAKTAAMIKDLDSKDPKVRAAAAVDIGDLADVRLADAKTALGKLKDLQKDNDPNVRKAVLEALAKIEPDENKTRLATVLKTEKDPIVLLAVVGVLQRLGPMAKDTVPALQEAHKISVNEPAPKTAPKTPPPGNMPPADGPAVRRAILQALGAIDQNAKGRIPWMIEVLRPEKDPGVRTTLINILGQLGADAKDAVPVLLEVQKASLQESGKPLAPKEQRDLDPQNVRRSILQSLGRIDPEPKNYVPRLIESLKTDKAPNVRFVAVQELGKLGPAAKEALPVLLDIQKAPPVPNEIPGLRKAVIDALVKIEPESDKSVTLLADALKRERDPASRASLVTALGDIGPPAKSAVPVLMDTFKTATAIPKVADPQGVRKAVVEAVGKIDPDPKTYVPFLVDAMKRDRDAAVRTTAVQALGKLGPMAKEAIPALMDVVKTAKTEQDKLLAKEAEAALGRIQGK